MFHVYTDVTGVNCACASDVNDIITQWFSKSPDITIYCELTDDNGESLSYWKFTNGDDLLSDDCNPWPNGRGFFLLIIKQLLC